MRIRVQAITLGLVCFLGVASIAASEPTCRIVAQQAVAAVRHHTAATLTAWKVWGEEHPGWKPKQHLVTAKPRHAVVECSPMEVSFNTPDLDLVLPMEPIDFYEPNNVAPFEFASNGVVPMLGEPGGLVGNEGGYSGGGGYGGAPPVYGGAPPIGGGGTPTGPPIPPVPEPSYVVLCGAVLGMLWRAKRRSSGIPVAVYTLPRWETVEGKKSRERG